MGKSPDALIRTRWAAVGAAVAISLGGSAAWVVNAVDHSAPTAYVPIVPCRLMDTRSDPALNVGPRSTPLGAAETYTPMVRGTNGNCTIPSDAVAVTINATIVGPSARSHLVVFPADVARPLSSSLNWAAADGPVGNAVTAQLAADGRLAFYNHAGTVDVIADIVGYYLPAGTTDPARVVWVATSGGDFTSVQAALDSIDDASPTAPYVIKIAPGTYAEPGGIDLVDHVDLEGSGVGTTIITCACGAPTGPDVDGSSATLRASGPGLNAEVRHITVRNTGPTGSSTAIWTGDTTPGEVSFLHVAASAGGSGINYAFANLASSPKMDGVTAAAKGGTDSFGVYNDQSSPTMTDITATVGNSSNNNFAVYNTMSSPTMDGVRATATGGGYTYGMKNYQSSTPTITDLTASATGGANTDFGMYNGTSASATVRHSSISGDNFSVFNQAPASAKVSYSTLSGGAAGGGFTCAFNVSATTLAALSATCS